MDKCPNCGYDPANTQTVKPLNHEMANYVFADTGKPFGILNSSDDEHKVQGRLVIREELWIKAQAAKQAEAQMAKLAAERATAEAKAKANPVTTGVTAIPGKEIPKEEKK